MMSISNKWHKIVNYEYWPYWVFYLPIFLLWPFYAVRGKSIVFFTASNPFIPMGGSIGESKIEIFKKLRKQDLAKSFAIPEVLDLVKVQKWMQEEQLSFPIIAKPDIGERGDFISMIKNSQELQTYAKKLNRPFVLQERLESKFEAGVMVIRYPKSNHIKVTSIVTKEFLSVTGNGKSSIETLMQAQPRARFQIHRLKEINKNLSSIPKNGEVIELEPIGNHKRGTKFINSNHLITKKVEEKIKEIVDDLPDFFFGRFDLKAPNQHDFIAGNHWKIMELNGAFSEPGHIYDPSGNLFTAWKDMILHWNDLATVSGQNIDSGKVKPEKLTSFVKIWLEHRRRTT